MPILWSNRNGIMRERASFHDDFFRFRCLSQAGALPIERGMDRAAASQDSAGKIWAKSLLVFVAISAPFFLFRLETDNGSVKIFLVLAAQLVPFTVALY